MNTKLVSVIIPTTSKEQEILKDCLRSIRYSTYKNIEVIVVNEGLERSAQRNIGMKRAKGDYFLILDSDQQVSPDLISECVFLIKVYDAIYIPEKITTPGFFGRLRDWERGFYTATAVDVVRFVKKGCPEFDEEMHGPEDSDWDRRIKGSRGVSKSCLYHYDNIDFIGYLGKKLYYSKSMKKFEDKNKGDQILDWRWRCFEVFFEMGKWKRVLKNPGLFICLMWLIFFRGLIYFLNKDVSVKNEGANPI